MRLISVEIEGYRSINEKIRLHFDPKVTVILGANDHGKTNLLEAIRHLNEDQAFNPDSDLNWDNQFKNDVLPSIEFELELEAEEKFEI